MVRHRSRVPSTATYRTRGKVAVATAEITGATRRASSIGSPSGLLAAAATTAGPGSSPTTPTATPPSGTSTNVSSVSTPGISLVTVASNRTPSKPIIAISLRGVAGASMRVSRSALRAAGERDGAAAGGRRPQARRPAGLTSEQRHALTRHVDERARDAVEAYTTLPVDTDPLDKQRARYAALKAARDRALVFVLAYTAVRVGELLRDPNDPRRRGVRWEEISRRREYGRLPEETAVGRRESP